MDGIELAGRADAVAGLRGKPVRKKQSVDKGESAKHPAGGRGADGRGASGHVGQLLRGAYSQAVEEAVPDDLMDLLNRLE